MKQQNAGTRDVETQSLDSVSWGNRDGRDRGHGPRHDPCIDDWSNESGQRLAELAHAIELEIIPRLINAHRATPSPIPDYVAGIIIGGPGLGTDDIAEFTKVVLLRDPAAAVAFIEGLQAEGCSLEKLYLDLIAPTARRLGEMWDDDLADFVEVTLALGRLQHVLHRFSDAFLSEVDPPLTGHRILLTPIPGDQHTFGLIMVAEFFRRAGWNVLSRLTPSVPELVEVVQDGWFSIVGFSANSENRLDALAASIGAVRRASRNPLVNVMVGGPLFIAHPEFVGRVGADSMAENGKDAVAHAETLVAIQALRGRASADNRER